MSALKPELKTTNRGRKVGFLMSDAEAARQIVVKKLGIDKGAEGRFAKIVDKAIDLAENGDPTAREWVINRAIGKIPEIVGVDINKTTINIDVKTVEDSRKAIRDFFALNTGEQRQE